MSLCIHWGHFEAYAVDIFIPGFEIPHYFSPFQTQSVFLPRLDFDLMNMEFLSILHTINILPVFYLCQHINHNYNNKHHTAD